MTLIEHTAPEARHYLFPDGSSQERVWSQYGHMNSISNNPRTGLPWQGGDYIFRGEQLGTVGDFPAGSRRNYHLHFEIRKEMFSATAFPCGRSEAYVQRRYVDPTDFINLNRSLD